MRFFLGMLLLLATMKVDARFVAIHTEYDEVRFESPPYETATDAILRAGSFIESAEHIVIEISPTPLISDTYVPKHAFELPRRYHHEVSDAEKRDIHFIVTTLANRSLIAIGLAKAELEAAGARVEHLHPFSFLLTIFTSEELKVGIKHVRGKGWVWNQFLAGLQQSLAQENEIGNLCETYIHDFAGRIEIDAAWIMPIIEREAWDELLDALIAHVPRKGDHHRYDCTIDFYENDKKSL